MALALALCAGAALPGTARAQASADSAAAPADSTRAPAAPADSTRAPAAPATAPGETMSAYGLATDSLVRARCEGAAIRRVDVSCLDIFDPVPDGPFSGVYRAANRLHVRTRPGTVRAQLLVAAGQPWTADRIAESERLLRELEYVEPSPIASRLVNDSVDLRIVTHDQWTTQPELNLERGGGRTFGSAGFNERNLAGLGLGVSVAFRNEPTGHTRTAVFNSRQILGSQLEGQFRAGTGSGGVSNSILLRDPFRSLDDPLSWTFAWARTSVQQLLFQSGSVAAEFPFRLETALLEYGVGKRFPDGLVRRFTFGYAQQDRRYGVTVPTPGVTTAFAGGDEDLRLRWLFARVTFWRPHWIERRGVELFDPIEDFDVGSLVSVENGLALRALGSTADEGRARFRLETGREIRRFGFGFAHGQLSTRIRGGPRETLAHLDARWIQQPAANVTIVAAVLGDAADRPEREVQSVVGGLNGLRAYPVQELAGTQMWRFNAETRWIARREVWHLASVGGATFVDAARAWGPGGDREPWHHDAGFGLRLSFPHASLHQVARFDVAFPLSPTRDGRREPVFSFGSSQAF